METKRPALPRGRPRTITRERIANAGIALGLPKITIVGIAAKLGISHMALYKHVPGRSEPWNGNGRGSPIGSGRAATAGKHVGSGPARPTATPR